MRTPHDVRIRAGERAMQISPSLREQMVTPLFSTSTWSSLSEKQNLDYNYREGFPGNFPAESSGESTGDESNDCWIHMLEYNPPCWSSSSWVPCSSTTPSLKTRIKSRGVYMIKDLLHHLGA